MNIVGKKSGLSTQVFSAMILGAVFGLLFGGVMVKLEFIGTIWLNCIKMIVVPMVLMTIITGITSQKDLKSLGRIAVRIMVYYVLTTLVATVIGLATASVLKPGVHANFTGLASKEVSGSTDITIAQFFTNMFSSNMFVTFSESNILQTVVIAVMLGVAIMLVKNDEHREKLISGANALCTYYLACILQVLLVYGLVLWFAAGISPLRFIRDSAELWVYTLSTCSSVAAIPVNMKVAREKFNVPDSISSFTVPLGSQMNYDGSVILYGCVIMFISQVCGQSVSLEMMLRVVLLSAILSTGGGGIPGSGIVKLLVMVEAFSLPTEIVGIIAAFYRLFDMGTTTNNSLGDLAGTVLVSKLEEKRAKKLAATQDNN